MALLPPFFLDTVAAIGKRSSPDTTSWRASAFLFGEYLRSVDAKTNEYRIYLVTNRHVLENETAIVVRFSSEDGAVAPAIDLPIVDASGNPIYVVHADPKVDIAVLPFDVSILKLPGTKFSFFRSDREVMGVAEAKAAGMSEGDGLFVLGFPLGQVGGERNYVIVRDAILARARDALAGATTEYLIDASVFPGNSGGPVVTRPELVAIQGTQPVHSANLIGVVAGYVAYNDVAVSKQTGQVRVVFTENSELAAAIPIDYVRQAIQQHISAQAPQAPTVTATGPDNDSAAPTISQPPKAAEGGAKAKAPVKTAKAGAKAAKAPARDRKVRK